MRATSGHVPLAYFVALSDNEADGEALYNLHHSRVQWNRRQSGPQVDGGL